MLSGTCFGNDALLAHAFGDERLSDRVVDLVRAGVIEVLALEQQPEVTAEGRKLRSVAERRRTADVVLQDRVELAAKRLLAAQFSIGALEFVERGHESFRDVLAAELSEVA